MTTQFDLESDLSRLLKEAASDPHGMVRVVEAMGPHYQVQTNGREFLEDQNPRLVAHWKEVIEEAIARRLITGNGRGVHTLTAAGYRATDPA